MHILCANISQAKSRVERANLTSQDRLVKELRLRKISTMEAAHTFAELHRRLIQHERVTIRLRTRRHTAS